MSEHFRVGAIEHKRCSKCGTAKPLIHFAMQANAKDGLRSECRECDAQYNEAAQARKRAAEFKHDRLSENETSRIRNWALRTSKA